jgi:hypothetical protein
MTSQYKNHTARTRAARGTRIAASATTTSTSHNNGMFHLNAVTFMNLIAELSFSSQRSTAWATKQISALVACRCPQAVCAGSMGFPDGRLSEQTALGEADAVDQDNPEEQANQARRRAESPIELGQIDSRERKRRRQD